MSSLWTIAKRELYAYFASPIAYLVAAAFLFLCGLLFIDGVTRLQDASLLSMFSSLSIVLIFVAPVLTMRLLSREQDLGTIELLLTAPVRDWEVVAGKFLASFLYYLGLVAFTGLYVIVLAVFGNPDFGTIGASYLGLTLLGAGLLSLGTLASSLTRSQVVAAVIGVVASVSLWLLDILSEVGVFGQTAGDVISFLTPSGHYYGFLDGVVDTRDVVYYASLTFVFLFLASRVLESRRWQG
jgi:ABC-2 type transport system permease protein